MTVAEKPGSRRERVREATYSEIKAIARQQIAEHGTSAISLRAIATQMGLTPPALYRYYKDRDELITALLVDAFNSFADALEAARDAQPPEAVAKRIMMVGLAYRDWSLAYPSQYALIFGESVPGYRDVPEQTTPAAVRGLTVMVSLFQAAWQAGLAHVPSEYPPMSPSLLAQLQATIERADLALPVEVLHIALVAWSHIQGLVSLEIFGHLRPIIGDPTEYYSFELTALLRRFGIM